MSTKLADGTSIIYQRDATDRIVSMTTTDADGIVTVVRYGFTGASDAPDYTYSNSTQAPETFAVSEHTIGLPGGVTVSIQAEQQTWSYPNIQGGIAITTDAIGIRTGTLAIYDPFGNPINLDTGAIGTTDADTAVPDNTTTAGNSYGWGGSHQKAYQHTAGLTTIEMGARQYVPLLGRFLSTDPIAGGNDDDYNYPNDPINSSDLDGNRKLDQPPPPRGGGGGGAQRYGKDPLTNGTLQPGSKAYARASAKASRQAIAFQKALPIAAKLARKEMLSKTQLRKWLAGSFPGATIRNERSAGGAAIFKYGKMYFTQDRTGHLPDGVFKGAYDIRALQSSGNVLREGTYNPLLEKVGK
jgi:RHS repeat-associated protein